MVDAHHIDGMFQMSDSVHDVSLSLLRQESVIERGMSYATLGSKRTHLVISQVARHIAKQLATAMATHDRLTADFQCIVETLLTSMTQIYHDAETVHLMDYLFAKAAHAIVGVAATGAVADVVVAVVTERDLDDASLGKVLHLGDVML